MPDIVRHVYCPGRPDGRECHADLWPRLRDVPPRVQTVQVICPICTHTVTLALTWATVEAIVGVTAMAEKHNREER